MAQYLVLGAGFTGSRVVRLLVSAGQQVRWTNRTGAGGAVPFDAMLQRSSVLMDLLTPETIVLHSVPTLTEALGLVEVTPRLVDTFRARPPLRVVYLSTTGVYGRAHLVDEHTLPAPQTARELLRVSAEQAVCSGPWSSLILRPAAIYGPHRGIHASMRTGRFRLPQDPSNFVSRIHVDDLAAHAFAALTAGAEGAYPVADEEPCTSLEAAQLCTKLLGIPLPSHAPIDELGETRRADRRVNGRAIRELLGIQLQYPSYRVGFPACLAAEARERSIS